jgi:hypothetical protein
MSPAITLDSEENRIRRPTRLGVPLIFVLLVGLMLVVLMGDLGQETGPSRSRLVRVGTRNTHPEPVADHEERGEKG